MSTEVASSIWTPRALGLRYNKGMTGLRIASALFLGTFLFVQASRAGFIEIGAAGSYRKSNIDVDAFDESQSITASASYYFNEASALELSYTDGMNKRVISQQVTNGRVTSMTYSAIGLDFVYTFGSREVTFRPYLKGGVNYILEKRIIDQIRQADGTLWAATDIKDDPALVPSAGFGFKLGLTENLSLKIGVDAWSSRPLSQTPVTFDYAGRAGLSWLF